MAIDLLEKLQLQKQFLDWDEYYTITAQDNFEATVGRIDDLAGTILNRHVEVTGSHIWTCYPGGLKTNYQLEETHVGVVCRVIRDEDRAGKAGATDIFLHLIPKPQTGLITLAVPISRLSKLKLLPKLDAPWLYRPKRFPSPRRAKR